MSECVRCERPMIADQGYGCATCGGHLVADLERAAGLLPELDVTITRQAVTGGGSGRPSGEQRLAFDLNASQAADSIENTFATWARLVSEERGIEIPGPAPRPGRDIEGPRCKPLDGCPHASCRAIELHRLVDVEVVPETALAAAVRWLAGQVEWIRHQPFADEALDELGYACWLLRSTVDRRPDRVYLGQCWARTIDGECQEDVYAAPGASYAACRACGAGWGVQERRAWLLRAARDMLATATQIAYVLSWLAGRRLAPATVRSWVHRGRLLAKGRDPVTGDPTYRVGDGETLLESQVKPKSATLVDAGVLLVQRLRARGCSAPKFLLESLRGTWGPGLVTNVERPGPTGPGRSLLADVLLRGVDDGLSVLVGKAVDSVRRRFPDDLVGLATLDVRADAFPITDDGVLLSGRVLQHLVDEGLLISGQGLLGRRAGVGLIRLGLRCTSRDDKGNGKGEHGQGAVESHGDLLYAGQVRPPSR